MNTRKKTQFMTMTALLTAIAILIPIVMPFKIVIPPASYTLGSHIAIFIAMFLSPLMAVFVILASSFGFLMAGYPMVIVFRAFFPYIFWCFRSSLPTKIPRYPR
ncbi:putative membrane protein [Streptococcus pneumoniae 2082170]|nr:putative membrane protein [Streptococcus pneumoniae 2082170]